MMMIMIFWWCGVWRFFEKDDDIRVTVDEQVLYGELLFLSDPGVCCVVDGCGSVQ